MKAIEKSGGRVGILSTAFLVSVPVLLGYIAIGIAFGLLFASAGFPWYLAPAMSLLVYAGAAQFMAVGLLGAHAGLAEIAVTTLLINARHMVYGLSLLSRFEQAKPYRPYLIFALTDETYGLLTTVEAPERHRGRFYAAVAALDQSYWIVGTAIGALIGAVIPFDTRGLDFALTALFVVLFIEQTRSVKNVLPYAIAALSTAASYLALGKRNLLVGALGLSVALLVAARRRIEHA